MADTDWNFHVERVDLAGIGIDAAHRLGMVMVQPEYDLDPDGTVPFRIKEASRELQKDLIQKAFEVRAAESLNRSVQIPFILFPELSIPVHNPDGLDCLHEQLKEAEGDIIFIGGIEGISLQQSDEIFNRFIPADNIARPAFNTGAFVNICVIAIKSKDGQINWYFQAKLFPSQWEQPRNMAKGKKVLYFVAPQIAFFCQICFDHIAAQGAESLSTALCHRLTENTQPHAAALDFVFIPQYNKQPFHPSVRENTHRILYHPRRLNNEMTTIVVVNRASKLQESSDFGRSGFHYRVGRWLVPRDVGPKGYELYDFDNITSAIFRKRTNSIHVTTVIPPSYNIGNSGNPRQPLEYPRSYLITDECDATPCSCLHGSQYTVGRYVECDCLPCKLRDSLPVALATTDDKNRWQCSDPNQSELLYQHYKRIREDLLILSPNRTRQLLSLLLHMYDAANGQHNPDSWQEPTLQSEALVELLATLSVLAELHEINFDTEPQWTALLGSLIAIAVLDGADDRNTWATMESKYRKTFETVYFRPDVRKLPLLLVALRSDWQVQPFVNQRFWDFTEPARPNILGDDKNSFTKPTPMRFYICQNALFRGARQAKRISEYLQSEMRCILE